MTPYDDLPVHLVAELTEAGLDPREVFDLVERAVAEDLPGEDVTSAATIPDDAVGTADFAARENGVVAGLANAELGIVHLMGDGVDVRRHGSDGDRVKRGDVVLTATGPVRGLLTAERTALNFACQLSGVATAAAAWLDALAGTSARVLDTRKTLPGYRTLQKYAVRCGGGVNHRASLSDRALVKDNHVLAAGGVVPAFRAVRAAYPDLRVEVEVTTLDQLRELLDAGATEILLDNMSAETMREAVAITAGRATLEASGNLTLERAREVAETGVDFLSVGALTHSTNVFDLGMDLRADLSARQRAGALPHADNSEEK